MEISIKSATEVINTWDPVGLLAGGAPHDEYSLEIREIIRLSSTCVNEAELARLIYDVFFDKMGVKLNKLACLKYAFEFQFHGKNPK